MEGTAAPLAVQDCTRQQALIIRLEMVVEEEEAAAKAEDSKLAKGTGSLERQANAVAEVAAAVPHTSHSWHATILLPAPCHPRRERYLAPQCTHHPPHGLQPNIDCQTKKIDSKHFLSKIQRKDKTSKNEIKIGKKIIGLPKNIYSNRFAPILESCPIEIGKMEEQQFSTCKMIVQGKEKIKKTGLL